MPESKHEQDARKYRYLKLTYLVGSVVMLIFIVKYNLQYKLYYSNWVTIPLYLGFLATPIYYKLTNNQKIAMATVFVIPMLTTWFLIFLAGGTQAPGVFWLFIFPWVGGMLFGKKGSYVGSIGLIIMVVAYVVLEHFFVTPNVVADLNLYKEEKTLNVVLFFIFSITLTSYFVRSEQAAQDKLTEQRDQIDNLLRILIHDIATPLTVINMGIHRMRSKNQLDEKSMEKMDISVSNIVEMINQIREMKALKDGKTALNFEAICVNEVIKDALKIACEKSDQKEIKISHFSTVNGKKVWADSLILKNQIIMNLLTNAIKFSHPGDEIHVLTRQEHGQLAIEIVDRGIGIPQNILPHLFTVERPTSRSGTNGEKGTGYGMPLVKEFVERFQGVITIESRLKDEFPNNHGTTIKLVFPIYNEGTSYEEKSVA